MYDTGTGVEIVDAVGMDMSGQMDRYDDGFLSKTKSTEMILQMKGTLYSRAERVDSQDYLQNQHVNFLKKVNSTNFQVDGFIPNLVHNTITHEQSSNNLNMSPGKGSIYYSKSQTGLQTSDQGKFHLFSILPIAMYV